MVNRHEAPKGYYAKKADMGKDTCSGCDFLKNGMCQIQLYNEFMCMSTARKDERNVIFKRIGDK